MIQEIFAQLNIKNQCQKYGLPIWQCPQFLFLAMGIIIIFSTLSTYIIGTRFVEDPLVVALIVLFTTLVLFIIALTIVRSFERLAETSRLKSEFVSIVSHQLRSPLSNLKWAIEFLMSGKIVQVSEKQLEYFKILKENNDRMVGLVSDLLTVSRIEQGKLPLKKQNISLREITEKSIGRVDIFAKASNAEIKLQTQESLPQIEADPAQLGIAIENLLDNAIRYAQPARQGAGTENGSRGLIEIKISTRNEFVRFEIKDNGVGIPKSDQRYIFQKFFRSGNIMKNQTAGSGLGLYIAKSIIDKSGGRMGFKSQEGVGSTFWFTLPRIK